MAQNSKTEQAITLKLSNFPKEEQAHFYVCFFFWGGGGEQKTVGQCFLNNGLLFLWFFLLFLKVLIGSNVLGKSKTHLGVAPLPHSRKPAELISYLIKKLPKNSTVKYIADLCSAKHSRDVQCATFYELLLCMPYLGFIYCTRVNYNNRQWAAMVC